MVGLDYVFETVRETEYYENSKITELALRSRIEMSLIS